MIASLLLVLLSVSPCAPNESTVVCRCKQGVASACEGLRQTEPKLAAELEKNAAQRAAHPRSHAAKTSAATGQQHHIISKRIAKALDGHQTLRGFYKPRDPRFVTRAVDDAAHKGYQHWHRQVDDEVVRWLEEFPRATPRQFEAFLRELYSRPEMLARFPNGF